MNLIQFQTRVYAARGHILLADEDDREYKVVVKPETLQALRKEWRDQQAEREFDRLGYVPHVEGPEPVTEIDTVFGLTIETDRSLGREQIELRKVVAA